MNEWKENHKIRYRYHGEQFSLQVSGDHLEYALNTMRNEWQAEILEVSRMDHYSLAMSSYRSQEEN